MSDSEKIPNESESLTDETEVEAEAPEFSPDAESFSLPAVNQAAVDADAARNEPSDGEPPEPAKQPAETPPPNIPPVKSTSYKSASYKSGEYRVIFEGGRYKNPAESGKEYQCANGLSFNPELHATQPGMGGPAISRRGYIKRITGARGKRKQPENLGEHLGAGAGSILPGGDPASKPPTLDPASPGAPPPILVGVGSVANNDQAKQLARILTLTVSSSASAALGEWAAMQANEGNTIASAWETYLQTIDCSFVPAWAVPIMAMGPYVTRIGSDEKAPWNQAKLDEKEAFNDPENVGEEKAADNPEFGGAHNPDLDKVH